MTIVKEGAVGSPLFVRPAKRTLSKLRSLLTGPSGAGKTLSALFIARGLAGPTGKIIMIDTERGSGDLYASVTPYSIISLTSPFSPDRYVEAIQLAEKAGADVIIIDSLSHEWMGDGGTLAIHNKITEALGNKGNSWTAWRKVTPKHDKVIATIRGSRCHVIATVRTKQEHAQETVDGKVQIVKLGMAPVQRDDTDYEFDLIFKMNMSHYAAVDKGRTITGPALTTLFSEDEAFMPSVQTGEIIKEWLDSAETEDTEAQATEPTSS